MARPRITHEDAANDLTLPILSSCETAKAELHAAAQQVRRFQHRIAPHIAILHRGLLTDDVIRTQGCLTRVHRQLHRIEEHCGSLNGVTARRLTEIPKDILQMIPTRKREGKLIWMREVTERFPPHCRENEPRKVSDYRRGGLE